MGRLNVKGGLGSTFGYLCVSRGNIADSFISARIAGPAAAVLPPRY